jgi:hypothetical protein
MEDLPLRHALQASGTYFFGLHREAHLASRLHKHSTVLMILNANKDALNPSVTG